MSFDFFAIAQRLIDADPLFETEDIDTQQDTITAAVEAAGEAPTEFNIGIMLNYVNDLEYRERWKPMGDGGKAPRLTASNSPSTIINRFRSITGMTDTQVAKFLGFSRVTVNMRRHGKIADGFTPQQMDAIRAELENRALMIADTLDELARRGA